MPDKKLTDNEIIDGFNHCLYNKNNSCEGCCFKDVVCDASLNGKITTLRMVAEVLNRLQAENKRLSTLAKLGNTRANDYRVMRDRALKAEAENERLKQTPKCMYAYDGETVEYCVEGPCSAEKFVETIKAEAYKEFAEKLESIIMWSPKNHISITAKDVRNILQGLVGDNNDRP